MLCNIFELFVKISEKRFIFLLLPFFEMEEPFYCPREQSFVPFSGATTFTSHWSDKIAKMTAQNSVKEKEKCSLLFSENTWISRGNKYTPELLNLDYKILDNTLS